jgi:general secretion pathway protein K
MRRPEKNQHGIAMMVVLWVLVLLIALATEFAFSMKMEVKTTRNFKEDHESYYLAKAGIALAMSEILKPARFHSIHPEHGWISGKPLTPEKDSSEENETEDSEEKKKDFDVIKREKIPLGNGEITYTITDENGKIAINTASRGVLIKVMNHAGIEIGVKRDIIIDSILDWIDPDSNHRINGAEDDYYKNKGLPYTAKNGRIETLTELLKVRGMTKEILKKFSPFTTLRLSTPTRRALKFLPFYLMKSRSRIFSKQELKKDITTTPLPLIFVFNRQAIYQGVTPVTPCPWSSKNPKPFKAQGY